MGEWLIKRYGLPGWAPKVGDTIRTCRVPPTRPARACRPPRPGPRSARAEPDSDGDLYVKLLDGPGAGRYSYLLPKFLAHADAVVSTPEPTSAPAPAADILIGREYRLLPGAERRQHSIHL